MFKLDRLHLSGFKSFVDAEGLDFSGGMTAIVGPNGCGKSNVCDAVCWVLGERSAKSLRGRTMEDVIFNGSASRKPLGMAEVELTLATESSFELAEDGHLTIGRRVHRSGESQYLLNGKPVRLKEIKDLLMDTGLGLRAYSVIEQGRIGQILSGKPQERRRLLEEAAGITRYKERRRVAEFKLEEAKANLERLEDIVSEVERRRRSLKRQAGAARRFKERREAYRELLRAVLLGRWGHLHQKLAESRAQIEDREDYEARATAELQNREVALLREKESLEELARRVAAGHRAEAELAARIEGKQEFLKGSRQRLEELGERISSGGNLASSQKNQLEELSERLRSLQEQSGALASEREAARSEVSEDEQKISDVERAARGSESRLEELRQRLLQSISDVNGLKNRLHQEQVEREKCDLQLRHLSDELAEKTRQLQGTAEMADGAEAAFERLAGTVRAGEEALRNLDGELAELERRGKEITAKREDLTARRADLLRRQEVLGELERAQDKRRADLEKALAATGFEKARFLGDQLEAPQGWERSLDLFLGELEDAVVLSSEDDGLDLAAALTEGQVTGHLLEPNPEGAVDPFEIDDPAVGLPVAEALNIPRSVAAALPPAYFVESRADARRLARHFPGAAFISRERMWARNGVLHVQGRAARPGALAREHELNAIAVELSPVEAAAEKIDSELSRTESRSLELRTQRESLLDDLADQRKELAVAEARKEDLEGRQRRLSVEHAAVQTEKAEIDRTLGQVTSRSERLQQELERAEEAHRLLETEFDEAQKRVEFFRNQRETARTSGASRLGRLQLLDHRLESHQETVARIERETEETVRHLDSWRTERRRLDNRRAEIRDAMALAERELQEALDERDSQQTLVRERQRELEHHRGEIKTLEESIETHRLGRDEIRSAISDLRVEEAALKQDAEHLAEQFRDEFVEELSDQPAAPTADLEEREADLVRLKDQLDRTGPVNLLAAEEFSEQDERYQFLIEQRADVASSVESLLKTIREIDTTSSERFMKVFLEVNESFGRTFVELFRGGQAEMRLLDEEDILESGIEIVARPPGKRLQNMMLLSGGEKALTAIALLFGLFRIKPSPFCILDEVDAPLDDVNTLRFVEMLKQMSQETQFIVITHNKITMERASRLYGVTMQERGVSRLVAVDFEEIQPQPRAATA
jgi:chromosome segregation protein